jgi:N-acetylmuramic acid 6-phosphate etherase
LNNRDNQSSLNGNARQEAEYFLHHEKQFHLGMLPTEQPNAKTQDLDKKFSFDPVEGIGMLLSVDRDIYHMAKRIFHGPEFRKMTVVGLQALLNGKKIVFSGCGATGRLCILLESMWRRFFINLKQEHPEIYNKTGSYGNSIFSIMTGGDYALIRSVESFEDHKEFGRQQVREMGIAVGDVLIAITEGGETSSVLGTVEESADRGAKIFLLFNNPADILSKHIERSKKAIEDPRVTVLDLYCGPMAIAGSTRMQATTSEQLVAGAALEIILSWLLEKILSPEQIAVLGIKETDYAEAFDLLLDELLSSANLKTLAAYINVEKCIYQEKGLVTYFANDFLLDIFTDTTERAPTFMLPHFKKFDDVLSPPSWAFVKNPLYSTPEIWEKALGRLPRCLEWDSDIYNHMGAPETLASNPPRIDVAQIMKFHIGNEKDEIRYSRMPNMAVNILGSSEVRNKNYNECKLAFQKCALEFQHQNILIVGDGTGEENFRISCSPEPTILNLMEHLAIKLVINTISTGTMVIMGRVTGNWMTWVDVSNKKLKDRGIRLISEICGLSYTEACYALHETLDEFKIQEFANGEKPSPVQYTIEKIREKSEGT